MSSSTGTTLGIGILFPFVPATQGRDIMVDTRGTRLGRQRDLADIGRRRAAGDVTSSYGVLLSALYIP